MPSRLVITSDVVAVDANGDATLTFPLVPIGSVWTGSILLPAEVGTGAQWQVNASGLYMGTFTGYGPYGALTLYGSEQLQLAGSLIASSTAHATLLGAEQLDHPRIVPLFPT